MAFMSAIHVIQLIHFNSFLGAACAVLLPHFNINFAAAFLTFVSLSFQEAHTGTHRRTQTYTHRHRHTLSLLRHA